MSVGPHCLSFKVYPRGLFLLASIQLRLVGVSLDYENVPGNNLTKSLRLEDKLHRGLHKAIIITLPRQYLIDIAMAQIIQCKSNHGNATMVILSVNGD